MPWRMRHNAPQLGSPGYASTASVEVVHLPYLKKNSIRQVYWSEEERANPQEFGSEKKWREVQRKPEPQGETYPPPVDAGFRETTEEPAEPLLEVGSLNGKGVAVAGRCSATAGASGASGRSSGASGGA